MKFRSSILIPRVFDLTFIRNYKAGLFLRAADYTKPEMVSLDNWKRLLWIATDLKRVVQGNDRECLKYLSTKHVTLLFEKPHGRFQMSFSLACAILGARETSYYETNFENQPNPGDSGRVFSQLTDLFVLHGIHNDVVTKFAMNSTVPVFPATSNVHSLQKVLSDLMTLQEKFRRLKGLKMAWIGPPIPTLNTYLLLCPIFGININYLCLCAYGSGMMSPLKKTNSSIQEFKNAMETVKGANIIATSMHPEEKTQITMEMLKNADSEWVLLHTLPRSRAEVTDDVFYHENNLSWKSSANYLFVAMAVVLTSLQDYKPTTEMPNFDGN
ncbi:hypothetical protein RUM44_002174 [Polyplax serrata]|uniref:ornithine carbamoyltransferase n=1 Tax=Polyplax serrata TaxID=468196 RepID=A0ABR1AM51_POLSC